jgi:hypothetical protein
MVYDTRGYWDFCTSSIVRYSKEHNVSGTGIFPSSGEEHETLLVGPLARANLNHWTTFLSITTAIYTPEIRICQWELIGKRIIRTVHDLWRFL